MIKDRLAYVAAVLTLVSAFVLIGLITFWMVYPYKPITLNSVELMDKEVRAGGLLVYRLDYCKNYKLPATVTRAFVNGVVFTTPTIITNNPCGCNTNTNIITVPTELPSGDYILRTTWEYQVNPIRKVFVESETAKFKVNGSDAQRQESQE